MLHSHAVVALLLALVASSGDVAAQRTSDRARRYRCTRRCYVGFNACVQGCVAPLRGRPRQEERASCERDCRRVSRPCVVACNGWHDVEVVDAFCVQSPNPVVCGN